MCHAYNKKGGKTYNERNRTAKTKKNQNAPRKGNLLALREADNIKQVEMKEKLPKSISDK